MLYMAADEIARAATSPPCNLSAAFPVIRPGVAALSVCYFRDAAALTHMVDHFARVYNEGKARAIQVGASRPPETVFANAKYRRWAPPTSTT